MKQNRFELPHRAFLRLRRTLDRECRCGPCRGFTPQLIKTYDAVRAAGKEFEVVLIGSDRKLEEFARYHQKMPWLALPFEDRLGQRTAGGKFCEQSLFQQLRVELEEFAR